MIKKTLEFFIIILYIILFNHLCLLLIFNFVCVCLVDAFQRKHAIQIRIQSGKNIVYNPNCSIPIDYDAVNYVSNEDDRDTSKIPLILSIRS